jgi:hypothetical protein
MITGPYVHKDLSNSNQRTVHFPSIGLSRRIKIFRDAFDRLGDTVFYHSALHAAARHSLSSNLSVTG